MNSNIDEKFEELMYKCAPYLRGSSKKGTPLKTAEDIKTAKIKIPKTDLIDEEWKKNQKKMFWWADPDLQLMKEFEKENKLRERLIAIGGDNAAVINEYKNDDFDEIDLILKYGQLLYSGYNAVINPFTDYSNCHSSSQKFYFANRKSTKVCTGYALSEDGLWRSHSWILLMGKNNIIECTPTRRLVYYGIVLPDELFDKSTN